MKYVALIPSYEPDDRLYNIIKELYDNKFEIVLVNDGSSKEYDEKFKKCEKLVKYIKYDENHGKGYALKTGFKYIQENYKDVIVITMDSDGQHTVKDAKNLCNIVKDKDNTILLGRRQRSGKTPLRSMIGNSITRFVYRFSTGIDVYDTQTGLRAFKDDLIPFMLGVEGDRFEYEMNMLLDSPKNNIKLVEENIDVIYEDNNSGSHFNTIRDSYLIYKQIFKFLTSSVASFVIDYILYTIFNLVTGNLVLSNVGARAISSTFNYTVNKRMVFKDKESVGSSIFKYYLLAIFILTLNTGLLYMLVNVLHLNVYIAKVIVEAVLFCVSYFVQKRFVFTEKKFQFNKLAYSVVFGVLLVGFTTYMALDTFVLVRKMEVVEVKSKPKKIIKDENEDKPEISDNYYKDKHIEMSLEEIVEYNTHIYLVDVKIDDIELLQTAFAKNQFGRNIKQYTSVMAEENNAILAINGAYYGARENGYVVHDHDIYRDTPVYNAQALAIYDDGLFEVVDETKKGLSKLDNPKEVISFGPGLLIDGEIQVYKTQEVARAKASNPRTAIGMIEKGHYLFVVSDGRTKKSKGLSLYQLAKIMKKRDCQVAYNLDGGGSSSMVFNGKIINNPTADGYKFKERAVSDIVYIGY